jgi:NADH-quinone oxidoreductase subunit M
MTPDVILNLVLFLPAIGAIVLALMPKENGGLIRNTAFWISIANLFLSIALVAGFDRNNNGNYQFITQVDWIKQFHIQYKIGVDGISLLLILLTTLLSSIAILASSSIQNRVKEYYAFLLLLETGMIGVFCSLDLILFYVFWEAMLIPMYFLIGIWGGPRKLYATIKFVLYTLVGSLLMLVAIVWLYSKIQPTLPAGSAFDIELLTGRSSPVANTSGAGFGPQERLWIFLAFASAFAIKVPMFPFHTWLPDAHVEAPTAGSVILAGVLLKMGTYGFIRFCIPMFPDVAVLVAPYFLALAVIGIIYGALMALVQTDMKRLVAYSSVSHLGFCMLGMFAFTREGVAGSVLQMINHGLSTGALFLLVGIVYERRHTREISQFGGLWKVMPIYAAFLVITMLSSVGLPGLNGFVGEFLILLGSWGIYGYKSVSMWASILGATGVILGAIYMLWMFQRVMQGPLDNPENKKLKDLNWREIATLAPLVAGMFFIGIYPKWTLDTFNIAVNNTVTPIESFRANSPDYKPLVVQPALTTAASAETAPAGAPAEAHPAGTAAPGGARIEGQPGKAAPAAPAGAPTEAHPTENHAPAGAPAQVHP